MHDALSRRGCGSEEVMLERQALWSAALYDSKVMRSLSGEDARRRLENVAACVKLCLKGLLYMKYPVARPK